MSSRRLLVLVGALPLAAGPCFAAAARPLQTNASANALAHEATAFGLRFPTETPPSERPPGDEQDAAHSHGQMGAWLDQELRRTDDAIGKPPLSAVAYLEMRRDALERIVGVLEKGPPEWRRPSKRIVEGPSPPEILSSVRLHRILVAAALMEESVGHSLEASRLLEASWSLSHGLREQGTLLAQLAELGGEKLRVGVLRKVREPAVVWMNRLAGKDAWRRMLDAVAAEGTYVSVMDLTESPNAFRDVWHRACAAVAEGLNRTSTCEIQALNAERIWKPALDALEGHGGEEGRTTAELIRDNFFPIVTNALRRSARQLVDRELTLRILQLRLERAGSRDRKWPEKPPRLLSDVCPGVSYSYRSVGGAIEIAFPEAVEDPSGGVVLPLTFRISASSESRTLPPGGERP